MKAAITFDIDWAPDCAIDFAADLLAERGVKSTWFVTHLSPAVERLRSRPDLFELGIHPNFMPGSSHGATAPDVLKTCMEFVPDAVSMRTHGLMQSSALFDLVMTATPIAHDASLFLPMALQAEAVKYERFGQVLWRIPYVWEDDYVMEASAADARSGDVFSGFAATLAKARGIQVFNFHPIHVLLNSDSMDRYGTMKREHPKLSEMTMTEASPFVDTGRPGTATALIDLAGAISEQGSGAFVRELGG